MAKKYTTVYYNPHVLSLLYAINGLIGSNEDAELHVQHSHLNQAGDLAQSYSLKDIKDDLHMTELSQR